MVGRWARYEPGTPIGETGRPDPRARDFRVRLARPEDCGAVARISVTREGQGDVQDVDRRCRAAMERADTVLLVAEALVERDATADPPPSGAARDPAPRPVIGFGRAGLVDPDALVGARGVPPGWYLLGLVVVDDWRRRGVGLELTRRRLEVLAQRTEVAYYVANAANRASLDLHARLGFAELSRAFDWPGMSFEGGAGVLCRADLASRPWALAVP